MNEALIAFIFLLIWPFLIWGLMVLPAKWELYRWKKFHRQYDDTL